MKKKKEILLVTLDWGKNNHPIYKFRGEADILARGPDNASSDLFRCIRPNIIKRPEYDIIIVDSECSQEFWIAVFLCRPQIMFVNVSHCPISIPRGTFHDTQSSDNGHNTTFVTYDKESLLSDLVINAGLSLCNERPGVLAGVH